MNDLDLQSPINLSELVIHFCIHPFSFLHSFFHLCFPNSTIFFSCRLASSSSRCLSITCPFWMSGPPTSRTWATISREMVGSSTSPMSRTNPWGTTECLGEVLVKSASSSVPSFSPPSRTKTTLSWIGNVVLVGSFSSCICFLFFYFIFIWFLSLSFPYPHPFAFLCFKMLHHCMPLHSTPYCGAWVRHWCLQVHPPPFSWTWVGPHVSPRRPSTRLRFCSSSPEDVEAQFWFVVCVSSLLASNSFPFLSFHIGVWNMCSIKNESPIRVLNANMFATPSTTFELPSYAAELANLLAEAPSPPPIHTRPFNKNVLDFVDIEADQGEDSNRLGSPSIWRSPLSLEPPSHMYCFRVRFL